MTTPATKTQRKSNAQSNGHKPRKRIPQPKAGSPSRREMVEDLAQDIMALDRAIWRSEKDMRKRNDQENDLCFQDGRPVMKEDGEQATYKERTTILREQIENLETAFPTLMLAVRREIKRIRTQLDAQE